MRVIIKKHIHSGFSSVQTGDRWVKREYDMPFCPFVGLEVSDKEWSDTIKEVCYHADSGVVTCFVEDDETFCDEGKGHGMLWRASDSMMKPLMDKYVNQGWEIER